MTGTLKYRLIALAMVMIAASFAAAAQTDSVDSKPLRPVAGMFSARVGRTHLLDTYLSPVTYDGAAFGLSYEAQQATAFSPRHWVRQLVVGIDYDHTRNHARNHTTHSLLAHARWAMMHSWNDVFTPRLRLMAGPGTQLRGGTYYNSNNSNNVASVKVFWNVNLSAQAVYNTRLWRLPVTLRYQAVVPVAGVFFGPEYDESYYEIYLGNHRNLARFGWWGNRFDMENAVTADLHLGATVLRVGYSNRFETSWAGNISNRYRSHCLVIGIGGEFLSLGRKHKSLSTNVISSIYP